MAKYISFSQYLIESSKNFLNIKKSTLFKSVKYVFSNVTFVGWGRKKSGKRAVIMSKLTHNNYLLLEDGFIRSFGLGVNGSPSFALVEDYLGIYYDATSPSELENILNNYDFNNDKELMIKARQAKSKIKEYKISKYNNFKEQNLSYLDDGLDKVLIIAQTAGDNSLKYGLGDRFSTKDIITDAINENPQAAIYIKIHPDVLSGKKESDLKVEDIPDFCHVMTDNINPISLMDYFEKIYTKTSGMGMEALLLDKEVHCYGMPFYAGWGLTIDKLFLKRRKRVLNVDELFAGAYILYTKYFNPYINEKSDILKVLDFINSNKKEYL